MKKDEGQKFLSTDDGFAAFEGVRGSPKYWQKLKFDMIAKLEQLGPFTFFYTLSCGDRRWDQFFATIVTKKCPDLLVMHVIEENGVRLYVDKKSYIFLAGTVLEYSGGLNGKGFVFNNPNAKTTCGCGTSFSV